MKTSRIAAAVLVAFLSSSVPHRAAAQDDPVTMQARARFKEGVDFYDKGQYENARLAFLQAYALKKHPAVLLNLAQSSAKSNHALEAAKYFQQFLKESTSVTPAQKQDAESGLAEVRQKLGRIEIVAPAGTDITLDEKERLGTAPFAEPIDVEPGTHALKSSTETVRVSPNAGQKLQARFGGGGAPVPVPVPVPTTTPGGGEAPPPPPPPPTEPAAKHTNLLSRPDNMVPVVIGLSVGAVGLIGAIVFAAFKSDAQSKADGNAAAIRQAALKPRLPNYPNGYDGNGDGKPDAIGICTSNDPTIVKDFSGACQTLKSNNDKVDTNATIANVSVVVMVVGLATAAGWYLFAPKRDDQPSSTADNGKAKGFTSPVIVPYAGYGSGGLILSGQF